MNEFSAPSQIRTSRPITGFRATSPSQNPLPVGIRGGVKVIAVGVGLGVGVAVGYGVGVRVGVSEIKHFTKSARIT